MSAGAAQVMTERGVRTVARHDLFDPLPPTELPYDTILLLMNGLGLAGTLDGLDRFLASTPAPCWPPAADSGHFVRRALPLRRRGRFALRINLNGPYYGEVEYRLSYKGQSGEPFPWLFVDAALLNDAAETAGYTAEFLSEDDQDQYLVRLMPQGVLVVSLLVAGCQ